MFKLEEKGSAFPDVCCSFDLLLQLKPHPAPPPHLHRLARLLPQQHGYKDSNPTLFAAYAPTCSSIYRHHIHSSQQVSNLGSLHQTALLLPTS
ncbi:hypothetical protein JOB18_033802 [Solea senegalensis]|uniref:Uncharacterized protein n=1 Tax=Solea senegalensis TaxID=28829 RepID=A0AAV6T981_SOLSE|nr:hypothetical protein JOB18_033802 [Solea senegalensis]